MVKKRSHQISTFGSQLTSIISVALVLLILGVLAMVAIAGNSGADMLRGNIGFIVKLERQAPETEANRLKQYFTSSPAVESFVYSSAEEILASESQYLGEDIAALVDVNPYGSEFDVKVTPAYANVDSIEALSALITADPAVSEVMTESAIVAAVNAAVDRMTWILLAIAAALLVISVVLIFNTVHLAVYSRRFVIHTMKLVGATGAFIRAPFLRAGAVNGLVSALIASLLLFAALLWGASLDTLLEASFTPARCLPVFAGLFVAGVLICTVSSAFATNRYLRADYDDMFK